MQQNVLVNVHRSLLLLPFVMDKYPAGALVLSLFGIWKGALHTEPYDIKHANGENPLFALNNMPEGYKMSEIFIFPIYVSL